LKQTFKKGERLRSRRTIDRLFKRGSTEIHTFYLFPFRVLYLTAPLPPSSLPEVLFSVSKRNFKKAVDRNHIRRRCREAYRLNKASSILLAEDPIIVTGTSPAEIPTSIAFLYLAKEKQAYDVIEKAMVKILSKMAESSHKFVSP